MIIENMSVLLVSVFYMVRVSYASFSETDLVDFLVDPSIYNKRERPQKANGEPTVVDVSVFFNSINHINEISMEFTIDIFLRQMWTDQRLAFENISNETSTITLHHSFIEEIWQPDLYIKNEISKGARHDITVANVMLTVTPAGRIFYSQRISTTLGCFMNLRRYPLDTQKCTLAMESYGHSSNDIIIKWHNVSEPLDIAKDLKLPEFAITSYNVSECTAPYTIVNITGAWSCIYADFVFQRLYEFYIIQIYAPSTMIVILSWVSFWIDIHAVPARVTLGLLTILTITTQSSGMGASLPKVSYIKAIDVWMFTCMTFVVGSLLEYSAVNVLAREQQRKAYLERINEDGESKLNELGYKHKLFKTVRNGSLRRRSKSHFGERQGKCSMDENVAVPGMNVVHRWWVQKTSNKALLLDIVSRIIFPFTFLLFNVIYWMYYTGTDEIT